MTYFANSKRIPPVKGEDIKLEYVDTSYETGMAFYALSARVSLEDWNKIKHLFEYHKAPDEDTFSGSGLYGWLTVAPTEVEKLLGVKSENTLEVRKAVAKRRAEERSRTEE